MPACRLVPEKRWRLFVAVPLPDDLRDKLGTALEPLRRQPVAAGLRWSEPDSWHVTLAFLGMRDVHDVPSLVERLRSAAAAHSATLLTTGGLGAFPSTARARVVWYGVHDPNGRLEAVVSAVREAVGVQVPGPYRAHITLARARRDAVDARSILRAGGLTPGTLAVDRLDLMRSDAARGRSQYDLVSSFELREVGA